MAESERYVLNGRLTARRSDPWSRRKPKVWMSSELSGQPPRGGETRPIMVVSKQVIGGPLNS